MGSYNFGKQEIVQWLYNNFTKGNTCLDVGACDGKWFQLLGNFFVMDAVEIFEPNIIHYNLKSKYRQVFNMDISDFKYSYYDCIIFGDVIEHMTIEQAQNVLQYANNHCKDMIIAVPFLYPQNEIYGNKWEKHIQEDLTDEIFHKRYGNYEALWINNEYGYYHK